MVEKPKKVAVLLGGCSSEREISIRSGKQISKALAECGYLVREIDPAEDLVRSLEEFSPDVVFIALHGRYGEDGTIQGLLEMLGFVYTGSGVLASALAMDKVMTKKILIYEGIETPPFYVFNDEELTKGDLEKEIANAVGQIGLPMVIKPARQGSTIGISVARSEAELERAINEALKYDTKIFGEKFIEGVEVTASVLGSTRPQVLPLIEIVSETGFYDYTAKYSKGLSHHIIPARISQKATRKVEELALRTFKALDCRQFARVDFIVGKDETPYVLEINTIPGMTELSLFPDAAKAAGISFSQLVSKLVDEAWLLAKN
ncbi:MAG: D-alanine--D-alanine ligase family protein [Thermacetogeniaceae bacterium]